MPKMLSDEEIARRRRINRYTVPVAAGGLLVLIVAPLLLGGGSQSNPESVKTAQGRATDGSRPRPVEAPSTTTLATTNTTAAPTTTATSRKVVIPGLDPLDVTLSLKQRHFSCGNASKGQEYWTYSCDQGTDNVSVFTTGTRAVDQIEVSAFGTRARDLMGFVATAPFTGSSPREARAWVDAKFDEVRQGAPIEATFGGVPYTMYGDPSVGAYYLEIGKLSD